MHATHMTITIYSNHFSVTKITPRGRVLCLQFSYKLVEFGYVPDRGQMRRVPLKVYACSTIEKTEFRFHINSLKDFKEHLKFNQCDENMIRYITANTYVPECVDLFVRPEWIPRENQVPIVEYLLAPFPTNKLVGLQTGQGKSLVSLLSIAKIGHRFILIIKAGFIEKWINDILKTYFIEEEEICVVQGNKDLKKLIKRAVNGEVTEKAIIISNATFQAWMKAYERFGEETKDMGYPVNPYEMFETLKAGVRLIDEVHMSFHLAFKTDLYTHVPVSIALSATLLSDNPFITKMQELAYPVYERYKTGPLKKYIDSYVVLYRFKKPEHIKTTEYGSNNFSMGMVEKCLAKHVPTLNNYFELINYTIQISYLQCKREKKRMLIFAYSVELITRLVSYLKFKYPQFDIRRYVADDDFSNLMEADICVSTLGSSGTAVDIPDLTTVIQTTIVNSTSSNVQSLGRLRELNDKHPVEFYYFSCEDISKSIQYDASKREMLKERAKSFRPIYSGHVI